MMGNVTLLGGRSGAEAVQGTGDADVRHGRCAMNRIRVQILAFFLSAAMIGCDVSGIPKEPRRITVAIPMDITTLDPATTFIVVNHTPANLAYERLVDFVVKDGRHTGEILGGLAKSWQSSNDGMEWTFTLNSGHRFDDGAEVTAEAVKFTFDRVRAMGLGPAQALWWMGDIKAIDRYAVQFQLKQPVPFFLKILALAPAGIINPQVMRHEINGDMAGGWLAENTAGSGPYRVARFARRERVVLEPNPFAKSPPQYFTEVNLAVIKDDTVRAIQLAKGDVDIMDPVSLHMIPWLKAQPNILYTSGLSPSVTFLHMNNERPPFTDPRVRQAVAQAIDRDLIIRSIFKGTAEIIRGALPAGVPGHDPDLSQPPYDLVAARALLVEAGVAPGAPITFTVVGDGNTPSALAIALRNNLTDLGFAVAIEQVAAASRVRILKGDYDVTLQTISLDFPDPWIVFNFVYNSAMIGAANMPRYANEQVDALLAQADGILDEDARVELYQKAQRLVMADMPTVPLFQIRRTVAVRSDARGLDYNFSQPFFYNFQSMRREASGAQ